MKKIMLALSLVLFTAVFVAPSMAEEKTLTCKDCACQFTFTEAEQAFYKQKGFGNQPPDRCPDCRKIKKQIKKNYKPSGRGSGHGTRPDR